MKKTLGLLILVGLVGTSAMATDAHIDYAHQFDFKTIKTFQYVQTTESNSPDKIIDGRIRAAILRYLTENRLELVEFDADLIVTYHLTTKDDEMIDTATLGYGGFDRGWGGWGAGMGNGATTAVSTYKKGILIIDAYGPVEKKLVWRGVATVSVDADTEKQSKEIDKIMKDLGKKWSKILAGKGK